MKPAEPRSFVFYWLGGKSETLPGDDLADALNRAGYGRGALAALDYYETVPSKGVKRSIGKSAHAGVGPDVEVPIVRAGKPVISDVPRVVPDETH